MDENPNQTGYTPVSTGAPPEPPPGTPPYPPPNGPPYAQPVAGSGLSDNSAAALSYITFIPAIIFLVMEPYNKSPFVRFHSWQSIAFCVVSFALHFILILIPFVGWILSALLSLAFFVVWIMTLLKASKGEWYKLPVIGDFAYKQAQS